MSKRKESRSRRADARGTSTAIAAELGPETGAGARSRPAPARTAAGHAPIAEWTWPALLVLGAIALLWACRNAPLGTAVADDYSFLYRLRFQRPLDLFDSMGAAFYWRPLSRQLYFSLVGPWLLNAPIGALLLNLSILLAMSFALYRVARRGFAAPVAAAIASFPLVSEPVRVLIGWPSGAQHLLASLFVVLTVHEALAHRRLTAGLAALAAVLSHELGALVLPLLPLIAWSRTRNLRETLIWSGVAVAVATLWAIGYAIALRHGVVLPQGDRGHYPIAQVPGMLTRVIAGGLNLEELGDLRHDLWVAYGVLFALVPLLLLLRSTRARMAPRLGVVGVALVWFVVGAIPLLLVNDWNAWRAWMPTLGFGLAATGLLGLASPWLAGAFVALRLTALLLTAPVPTTVDPIAPETVSHLSFRRLARLQRVVESTRREMKTKLPKLPTGAKVHYWWIPRLAEFGFQGPYAVRVWYGDSTLAWDKFGGAEGYNRPTDALVEFLNGTEWPALVDEVEVLDYIRRARILMEEHRWQETDSLFLEAIRIHRADSGGLLSTLIQNRARIAFNLHDFARADSLNQICMKLEISDPDPWALAARLAMVDNDLDKARQDIRTCLNIEPTHKEGLSIRDLLAASP